MNVRRLLVFIVDLLIQLGGAQCCHRQTAWSLDERLS
jgi:hypothetical protein